MEQRNITGQAFRVLTDAANGIFHRISLWTHADDVEMNSGDSLTVAMNDKYNINTSSVLLINTLSDLETNTFGRFTVNPDIGTVSMQNVYFDSNHTYSYFAYGEEAAVERVAIVFDSDPTYNKTLIFLRRDRNGWYARNMSSESDLLELQRYLESQIAQVESVKFGYDKIRSSGESLDTIEMNTFGSWVLTKSNVLGYHDNTSNITTYLLAGEYTYFSYVNTHGHKTIVLFSNSKGESNLIIGGAYLCTNTGMTGAPWVITRILSATDFSTDETGMREQIVASLTGQLWPVGAIYINLTRQNPGEFLGGTWNLITEGILTAIKGSPEQAGYHQRDLYKAVQDEDRGQHLYGVFAWQRIA